MPRYNESKIQQNCVRWFRLRYPKLSPVFFAIPNGGQRSPVTGAILKAEGVLAGVSDLMLAQPSGSYNGLFIEMKTAKGRQQDSQKEFQNNVLQRGYQYIIVRDFDQFTREIDAYLSL